MDTRTKIATGAAALVSAGSLAFAGASLASADTTSTPSATGGTAQTQQQGDAQQDGRGPGGGMRHDHTEVTGAELTKVKEAVTTKDSGVTVERVMKDPDGSYDVMGTKSGQRVMVEVSKDLATVEVRTGGPGGPGEHGGRGGHGPGGGMHAHTEVTGAELTKVKDAVTKKDSGVTVERVMKDPDGSYDVMGTKSGQRVMVEVSKDLATVEVRTGGPGMGDRRGPGAPDGHGPQRGAPQQGQQQGAPQQGSRQAPRTVPSTGTSPTDVPVPSSSASQAA